MLHKLALRNVFRQRVRSAITLAAIVFGVTGLILSGGFVQDVFVRVWLRRDNLRDDGTLQGYLLRSVYHASLNALKKGANATAYRSWVAQQIEQSCYAHYDPDDSEVIRKLYSQEIAGQIDAAVES